ncbi:MAG: helix-turn-helix domain-containing protein, partial [Actinomycetota bacterium]
TTGYRGVVTKLRDIGEQACSLAAALSDIGDAWSFLILREAFYGRTTFSEFVKYTNAQKTVVSARLTALVDAGIMRREQYSTHPPRDRYVLTTKGRDLSDALLVLGEWGRRWADDDKYFMVDFVHDSCGHTVDPQLSCGHCGGMITPDTTTPRINPRP